MRYIWVLIATLFFSGQALSGQCPTLVKQIDSQLESAQLDTQTRLEVEKLKAKGESLHSSGNHAESERVLRKAIETIDAAVEQAAGT